MIKAIIIDDEVANRNVLGKLLAKHCPYVNVIAEADSANSAYDQIKTHEPDLVFLDVLMPEKTGFDLLRQFKKIDFEIIFVSAFNEYAISAFDFNALDYVLKPIDFAKLEKAVAKAADKISRNHHENESILRFIKTLDEKNELMNKFTVHHNDKVVFINIFEVVFIEAKADFCSIHLSNGSKYSSSKDLKLFEDAFSQTNSFVRVSRSLMINVAFVSTYTKGDPCIIELTNGPAFEVSRRKKTEVLNKLRK
jgi:two-component system, LytTR family, response regulator